MSASLPIAVVGAGAWGTALAALPFTSDPAVRSRAAAMYDIVKMQPNASSRMVQQAEQLLSLPRVPRPLLGPLHVPVPNARRRPGVARIASSRHRGTLGTASKNAIPLFRIGSSISVA